MIRSIESLRRLNIGCGPHHALEKWWNVDIQNFPCVDQTMDVTTAWPFKNLDFVYAEHFLEHLTPKSALEFLRYAHGALNNKGRIRLSTPSLEWVLKTHFTFSHILETQRLHTLITNRAFHGWGHKFLYSRSVLEWVLSETGYADIEFFQYGESNTRELIGIENHGDYSVDGDFPSVWIVEATPGEFDRKRFDLLEKSLNEHFTKYVENG